MIRYIDEDIEKEGPFFSYISFQAQHIPLQAPKKYTDKYLDLYRDGWASLREDRKNAAIEKGIFASEAPIVDSLKKFDAWEDLKEEDRAHKVKSAAVFAGMLNAMDYHIGRFIDYLKAMISMKTQYLSLHQTTGLKAMIHPIMKPGTSGLGQPTTIQTMRL